jgi:hypothetical protein
MLLDIFDQNNSIIVNYKTIQVFGLPTAVYLTELLEIYKKATKKNKLFDDQYFKVDRKYVSNLLNLTGEEQLICDANLHKIGILKKHSDDPDIIYLDVNLYLSLLAEEDVKLIEDVKKQMKVTRPKGVKQSQRQQLINNLKNSIECSNYELLTALRDWVDGIFAKPTGFLSKTAIKAFQETLNNYTKGDLDLALRLVQIATIQGYKDCQWAINVYEKDKSIRRNVNPVRVTEQKVAEKEDLSDIIF